MFTRLLKYGLWFLATVLALIVLITLAFNVAVRWPEVRDPILKQLEATTGYEVSVSSLSFGLWPQPHVAAQGVRLRPLSGKGEVEAEKLTFTFVLQKLLDFQFFPSQIRIYGPHLTVHPSGAGGWENEVALPFAWPESLEALRLFRGSVTVAGRDLAVESLNMSLIRVKDVPGLVLNAAADGSVLRGGGHGPFRVFGRVAAGAIPAPPREWDLAFFLDLQEWPLTWLPTPSAFSNVSGRASAKLHLKGSMKDQMNLQGELTLAPIGFRLVRKRGERDYQMERMTIDFDGVYRDNRLEMPAIRLRTADLDMAVALGMDLNGPDGTRIRLLAASNDMPMEAFLRYYPSPLLPQWVFERALKRFSAGRVTVDSLQVNGTVHEIEKCDEPEHASAFSCLVTFRGMEAPLGRGTLPVKNFATVVRYEDGDLVIDPTTFSFGASAVRSLRLTASDILTSEKSMLNVEVNGDFQLEDVVAQSRFEEFPRELKGLVDSFQELTGKTEARFTLRRPWEATGPPDVTGTVTGTGIRVRRHGIPEALSLSSVEAQVQKNGQLSASGKGIWYEQPFAFKGSGASWLSPFTACSVSLEGNVDLGRMEKLLAGERFGSLDFHGTLPLKLALERKSARTTFAGTLNIAGMSVSDASWKIEPAAGETPVAFRGSYGGESGLVISSLDVGLADSKISASVSLRGQDVSVDLKVPRLNMCDLGTMVCSKSAQVGGLFSGELHLRRPGQGEIRLEGLLRGANLSLPKGVFASPVQKAGFVLRFTGDGAVLESSSAMLGDRTTLSVTGSFKDWRRPRGELSVASEYAKIDDLLPERKPTEEKNKPGWRERLRAFDFQFAVKGGIDEGMVRQFPFRGLSFNGSVSREKISIDYLNFASGPGMYQAAVSVPLEPDKRSAVSLHAEVRGQPFQEFMKGVGEEGVGLTGSMDLDADLKTAGQAKKDLMRNLDGTLKLVFSDGRISKSNILLKIFALLNVERMFSGRFPEFTTRGMAYDKISATFAVQQGKAKTEDFQIDGADVRFAATGSFDLAEATVDAEIGVAPLVTVDSIVSKIPLMGYLLTGKSKSLLTFYFRAKGPMLDPEVQMIPMQTMTDTIFGILKRTLTAPLRFLEKAEQFGGGPVSPGKAPPPGGVQPGDGK